MRRLSDILKFLYSSIDFKLIIYSLAVITTWSLFENYFVEYTVVNLIPFFEKLNFSKFSEIVIFTLFVVVFIIRLIQVLTKFCESKFTSYSILSFCGIYLYYRFFDQVFSFYSFSFLKNVVYLDFCVILFLSSFILLFINYYQTILSSLNLKDEEDEKLYDNPWESGDKDLLNRYAGAMELANKIITQKTKKSFAYGIVGGWGDGKTSFLNMIENEVLKNKKTIVVKFNPWKSSSSKNIQNDFLIKLRENLAPYSSEVPSKVNKYIYALLGANKNILLKAISIITKEQNGITKQFTILNSSISKINKKIVVVIDDLDRLDKEEVFEVLKLIRNIGNFNNTIFIATYDRNYINDAIKKFSEYKHEAFIEKIFQQEIIIPDYPYNILLNEFSTRLKEHFINEQKIIPEIESILGINDDVILFPSGIAPYKNHLNRIFINLRDVKRFVNSFTDCYSPLKEEVSFYNMFYLEILKTKYYKIFIELKRKTFLKNNDNNSAFYKFDEKSFDTFCEKQEVTEKDILLNILKRLFPDTVDNTIRNVIGCKKSFPIYLSNQLFNRLSRKEFYHAISGEKANLSTVLDKWLSNNYYADVREYLASTSYEFLENKNEFENYVELHFLLIDKDVNIDMILLQNHFYGEIKNKIDERFYDNEDEFNQYIRKKIETASSPFKIRILISELIRKYLYNQDFDFVLTLEELQQLALNYLKQYLIEIPDLNEDGMWLYYTCVEKIDKNSEVYLMKEASILMKEFITKKNTKYYLDKFIRPYYSPDDGHARTAEPFVSSIFGSFDEFEKFINNNKTYENIEVIKYFFGEFKNQGYQGLKFENPEKELKIKNSA